MNNYICNCCNVKEGELHLDNCSIYVKGTKRHIFFNDTYYCCSRCGYVCPELFNVTNKEWKFVCGDTFDTEEVLCFGCYTHIKDIRMKIPSVKRQNIFNFLNFIRKS